MKLTLIVLGAVASRFVAALPAPVLEAEAADGEGCVVPVKHTSTVHTTSHTTTHSSTHKTTTSHVATHSSTSKATTVSPKTTATTHKATTVSSTPRATATTKHSTGGNPFTSNGIKAGLSGYPDIGSTAPDAMNAYASVIGWYSDYNPNTPDFGNVQGIPMLWGSGDTCVSSTDVKERVAEFYQAIKNSTPKMMFGFYEPDCDCPMSSDMSDPKVGAQKWNSMLAPLASRGTKLGSPSMCKQTAENWLTPFKAAGLNADWDVTSIHVNVANLAGVQKDVEYYASTYGKPIWVSEFACVHAGNGFFNPCTDQGEIDNFINTVVPWLEANETVVAYGASNGAGLGNTWPLISNGELTHTGKTYLNALKNLH